MFLRIVWNETADDSFFFPVNSEPEKILFDQIWRKNCLNAEVFMLQYLKSTFKYKAKLGVYIHL